MGFLEKPIPINEKEILMLLKKGKLDVNIFLINH